MRPIYSASPFAELFGGFGEFGVRFIGLKFMAKQFIQRVVDLRAIKWILCVFGGE